MAQVASTSKNISGKKRRIEDSNVGNTVETSMQSEQPPDESVTSRKPRTRTRLKVMATSEKERTPVEWNERGQPVGAVSVQYSSTVGVIVREQVSCVIESWHKVDKADKERLWTLVLQKYSVDACYKTFVLQQMGKLWRSWKSQLSTQIGKILDSRTTKTERKNQLANLRPTEVTVREWDKFVDERMSNAWQEKSSKMKETREKLILNHTMSRKGYSRHEYQYNKEHPDAPLTKGKLWIGGDISKKKTSEANAAKIVEIEKKMSEGTSSDGGVAVLAEALGKDYPGRVRGYGGGVTKTKLNALSQSQSDPKYAKMEAKMNKMKADYDKMKNILASTLGINFDEYDDNGDESGEEDTPMMSKSKVRCDATESGSHGLASTLKSGQGSSHRLSINDKCLLLNWRGNGEEVAKGSISEVDPEARVHGCIFGPDCYRVSVDKVLVEQAELYRCNPEFDNIGDAIGSTVAWPIKYIVHDNCT